ncbi:MAG: ABC transporter ATP-binding protein [Candidatus Omnitrophica bacterium]|nr:ABC transporter ATP-binding protein [Candidatus Omnitrophota bacterium]MCM8799961.1 ABC transporter ATP-binding protein [Candidatus Omnitrophota bacterium]
MSEIAIKINNLGKLYYIGEFQPYKTLQESVIRFFNSIFKKSKDKFFKKDYIWALKDVSFEIEKAEVVGIIGRNGAGKSTLLKILSRITPPTEGYAEIYGKTASLLEIGTGFHSELTGRENIFFSAAVMGMKKKEIMHKFNQIVEFAEIGDFLDTPLKHYSSGMGTRLAFAIAAHLDSDILFVDEVLSVGDASFQKKCLGKIDDMARAGRTVLFVSHQMNQIRRLCQRCIWLEKGKIMAIGKTEEVASKYEASFSKLSSELEPREDLDYSPARFFKWEITSSKKEKPNVIDTFEPLEITFFLKVNRPLSYARHGIALYNSEGNLLWGTTTDRIKLDRGIHRLVYRLSTLPLKPGIYYWLVTLFEEHNLIDSWYCYPELLVATEPLACRWDEWAGFLNIPYEFKIHKIS